MSCQICHSWTCTCDLALLGLSLEPKQVSVPQHVYTRGGRAVVTGIPGEDHNCDEMSCPSVEHVLFRLPHSDDEKRDLFEIKAGCLLDVSSLVAIVDSPNFREYEKAMAKEILLHRGAKPCGCITPKLCAKCA